MHTPNSSSAPAVWRHTCAYFLLFLCMGMNLSLLGPTLPQLAAQTGASLGEMGWLFFALSLGAVLGASFGARVYDRRAAHPIMGWAQVLAGLGLCAVPFMTGLMPLVVLLVALGAAQGMINNGANTLLVWIRGAGAAPHLNALHLFFGVGSCISPAAAAQLAGHHGLYAWAYVALGLLNAAVGAWVLSFRSSPGPVRAKAEQNPGRAAGSSRLIVAAALYLFFCVGAELTFGGWIYSYIVTRGVADASEAAYLNAAFWGAFTLARAMAVPVSRRWSAARLVLICPPAAAVFVVMLLIWPDSSSAAWIVSVGAGFFVGPLYPNGFSYVGQALHLTARRAGLVLLGDGLGGMVVPWLAGLTIDQWGSQTMVWEVVTCLVGAWISIVVLIRANIHR